MGNDHMGTLSPRGQIDTYENITFPQLNSQVVKYKVLDSCGRVHKERFWMSRYWIEKITIREEKQQMNHKDISYAARKPKSMNFQNLP